MLCAKRKHDGQRVLANSESRSNAPFLCLECDAEVVLREGSVRVNYFAHRSRSNCAFGTGESDSHRRCKMEIYEALLREPGVTDVALEKSFQSARPDIFAKIHGIPVAIEVQISVLTMEKIIRRTEEYARKGIYVLWLPQWTPYLDGVRYSPRLWEKWIHAAYFGRVYFWVQGLSVVSYNFEPHFKNVPKTNWFSPRGSKLNVSNYPRRSKRYRTPIRGRVLNLVKNFVGQNRAPWTAGDLMIPRSKLLIER
jgi:competence protein CoiA